MRTKLLIPMILLIAVVLACSIFPQGTDDLELSGTVTHSAPTPVDKVDAKEAIQTYARDVLGLEIPSLVAGGTSGELSLPLSMQDGIEVAIDLAGTTYFGVWLGGVSSLSFGDSDVSGDLIADIRDGSLGVFAVTVGESPPTDPTAALDLIQRTYPALSSYEWIETPTEQGYSFVTGAADNVDMQSWSVELTGTTINAGVTSAVLENQSLVWVVVASGVLAAPFAK
jgi:hypothetical protein